jgi:low affinity Fe/Cu permease
MKNGKPRQTVHPAPGVLDYAPAPQNRFNVAFRRVASACSEAVGSKWAFIAAVAICVGWAATGPMFHFSETWQLVINTGTTIVTFLMVFLIQNTQNRDSKAIHLKLDELIRGVKGARTHLVNLEEFSDEELDELRNQFERVRQHAARHADEANHKADAAHETSKKAKEAADRAHDVARQAKEVAEDAHEDVERVANKTRER